LFGIGRLLTLKFLKLEAAALERLVGKRERQTGVHRSPSDLLAESVVAVDTQASAVSRMRKAKERYGRAERALGRREVQALATLPNRAARHAVDHRTARGDAVDGRRRRSARPGFARDRVVRRVLAGAAAA
jgi:hypothetical protein